MTLEELLHICKAYTAMGTSITDQMADVILKGQSLDEQNANALQYIHDWLCDLTQFSGMEDAELLVDEISDHLNELRNA